MISQVVISSALFPILRGQSVSNKVSIMNKWYQKAQKYLKVKLRDAKIGVSDI